MGCCECCFKGCARWIIGIVSICVIVCSVVAASVIYKKENDKEWSKLIKNNIPFVFILVAMAFAVVSSLIGFILCCCKKKCLYYVYLIIIIVVIIVEIVAIILAFVYKDKIVDGIDENWYEDKNTVTRISIEEKMKCCGFKIYKPIKRCGYTEYILAPPCYDQIIKEIDDNVKNLRICVIIMAVIELVLLVCVVYLVCTSKDD